MFEWKKNILWYKGTIYLNWNSKFKVKEIKESHDSPAVGHVRFFKYYYNGRRSFFWKLMQKYIQQYVAECNKCHRTKSENVLTLGLIQPIHIPNQKWEEISMDFIDGLPLLEGKDKILVVVDQLTKFAHFTRIKKIDMAKTNCRVILKKCLQIAWLPKSHRQRQRCKI